MNGTERRAGLYVITRGYSYRLVSVRVSLVASASERAMSFTSLILYGLRKDRLYPRLIDEISFELVGTECQRLVRRTNTSKSES